MRAEGYQLIQCKLNIIICFSEPCSFTDFKYTTLNRNHLSLIIDANIQEDRQTDTQTKRLTDNEIDKMTDKN